MMANGLINRTVVGRESSVGEKYLLKKQKQSAREVTAFAKRIE